MNEIEKTLNTLGEVQYSERKIRITIFYTFLLRGRNNYNPK